jgi:hypothetical protein
MTDIVVEKAREEVLRSVPGIQNRTVRTGRYGMINEKLIADECHVGLPVAKIELGELSSPLGNQ